MQNTPGVDARLRGIVLSGRLARPALEPRRRRGPGRRGLRPGLDGARRARRPCTACAPRSAELDADEPLYALLSRRALAAVALIHFLRAVSAPAGWRPPPLRATMHFDDPNLRWRSYGFINYGELLEHADAHGYHVAMATIPLDAGRPNRAAAALFRERPDRLSLVFHGNDHIKGELMAPKDVAGATAVAAQALRRVERFERRSGLHVDRVMTPPHGMCSEHMTRALGALGFDALAAIYPRPWTDRFPADPLLAGWRPADWVGGCAVIPRIPLSSSVADIALRAFLDHPVVLYAHHEDVAEGLEPLATAAAAVNRLGDVRWMSMGDIAASNGDRRLAGDSAVVRPFARRLRLAAEPGARTLRVQAPADALDGGLAGGLVGRRRPGAALRRPTSRGRATATSRSACTVRRTSTRATSPRRPGARGRSCAARPPRRATACCRCAPSARGARLSQQRRARNDERPAAGGRSHRKGLAGLSPRGARRRAAERSPPVGVRPGHERRRRDCAADGLVPPSRGVGASSPPERSSAAARRQPRARPEIMITPKQARPKMKTKATMAISRRGPRTTSADWAAPRLEMTTWRAAGSSGRRPPTAGSRAGPCRPRWPAAPPVGVGRLRRDGDDRQGLVGLQGQDVGLRGAWSSPTAALESGVGRGRSRSRKARSATSWRPAPRRPAR